MKTIISSILVLIAIVYFVMWGVGESHASDVYVTQSGASLTANVNQDGQTNKVIHLLYRLVLTLRQLTIVLLKRSQVVQTQLLST